MQSNTKKKGKKSTSSPSFQFNGEDGGFQKDAVDEAKLLSAFDSNKDGMLDIAELHALSEQLTNQIQYNNSLIAKVHELEEENFSYQQELHGQRDLIKNSTKKCDEALEESAEVKRKLKVTQGIADNLSKQLRDCRLENDLLKRDSESSIQATYSAKSTIESLTKELNSTKKLLSESEKSKNRALEDSRLQKTDSEFKLGSLQSKHEAITKENNEMKAKLRDYEKEYKELKVQSQEVLQSLSELKKQHDTEQFARQLGEKKMNALTANSEILQNQLLDKESAQKETIEKLEEVSNKLQQTQREKASLMEQLQQSESTLKDFRTLYGKLSEEHQLLQHQDEKKLSDLSLELKRQRNENDRTLQQALESHRSREKVLNDNQKALESQINELQQQLIDTYKAKALAEQHTIAMQSQLEEQHQQAEGDRRDLHLQLTDATLMLGRVQQTAADTQVLHSIMHIIMHCSNATDVTYPE